jgi:O-antigen/teichoic acid export membrane protein
MPNTNQFAAPLRVFTLILGALFTFLISSILINDHGIAVFATYSIFTSLPSLIPFADLGLGLGIYNTYTLTHKSRKLSKSDKEKIAITFYMLLIFSLVSSILIWVIFFTRLMIVTPNSYSNYLSDLRTPLILTLTFLSTPFTLGFRKISGKGRILSSTAISFLIPVVNFLLTVLLIKTMNSFEYWISFVPSISYFVINLYAFKTSEIYFDFAAIDLQIIRKRLNHLLKYALSATLFTTVIAASLQFPKYYFAQQNNLSEVAKYSIFLMIASSLGSLVITQTSVIVPNYKRLSLQIKKRKYLTPSLRQIYVLTLLSIIGILLGQIMIDQFLDVNFSQTDYFLSPFCIILYLIWVFYNSFLNELHELQYSAKFGLSILLAIVGLMSIIQIESYSEILTSFFTPFYLGILFVSLNLIFKKSRAHNE